MTTKTKEAITIVKNCIGDHGVWASADRYRHQCWTRDFCLATSYLFIYHDVLKNPNIVVNHLVNLSKKQNYDGKIPILYLEDVNAFLRDKIKKSISAGKISFMLERYLDDDLENLTPHTRDSEVLFIIAAKSLI